MTELVFKGKEFVWNHHLAVPFRPLEMQADKGIGAPRLDGNLIVQGDNLHALKALLPMYAGKVDCIFIDPPYNTGNEGWAYNDNVNAPMIREWLDANPIGIEDGLRHDKWCAMMSPRLRLLHELLAENGTIFVCIDDNEVDRLISLMSEIFGDEHFVTTFIWKKRTGSNDSTNGVTPDHDFVVCFAKSKAAFAGVSKSFANYSNPDNDPRGPWMADNLTCNKTCAERPNLCYPITDPETGRVFQPNPNRAWAYEKSRMDQIIEEGKVIFPKREGGTPTYKRHKSELRSTERPFSSFVDTEINAEATKQLRQIFAEQVFDYPKGVGLVRQFIEQVTASDSIILDSFAGSGTTAHAVLEANRRDGGNRRFILVEMEDYADRLTAERVRRVIKGYAFTGTQKTELLRERLNWRAIERANDLVDKVQGIENLHGHEYDRITKQVKDGELIVTGEKRVEDRAEGLGGEFTYCTLGQPVELDHILTGEDLPAFDALAGVLFHMATSQPLDPATLDEAKAYVGEANGTHVWLIYRPHLDWLKSPDAALTLSFARKLAEAQPDARHLVFAPARYVSQRMLDAEGLPVEFVPLPFALYRVERT